MPICKGCGQSFDWGLVDGKWVLLEPVETQAGMDRTYVDENGELRADHRDKHPYAGTTVNATRLDRKVQAADVDEVAPVHKRLAAAARVVRGTG